MSLPDLNGFKYRWSLHNNRDGSTMGVMNILCIFCVFALTCSFLTALQSCKIISGFGGGKVYFATLSLNI